MDKKSESQPQKYDNVFEQFFNGIVSTLERYEFFIDRGFDKSTMKPDEVFKMAHDYASDYAKGRNVNFVIEGADVLTQYQHGSFSAKEQLADYELYTLFANLMQNAVKYTREGTTVNVKFAEQTLGGKKYLTFSVRDEGIGIPKDAQPQALKGKRAQNAIDAGIQGTGYGLRRIRRIIEDVQGRDGKTIEINSPLNPLNEKYPGTEITAYLRLKDG